MTILEESFRAQEGLIAPMEKSVMPVPESDERPTRFADRVGEWYSLQVSDRDRKRYGLYLTPIPVADFMSERIRAGGRSLRILDPAAGSGILCCAAVETLLSRDSGPDCIELFVYEVDQGLIDPLRSVLDYLVAWCRRAFGVVVVVNIRGTDFILAQATALKRAGNEVQADSSNSEVDIVIANPPYFKIGKSDPRSAVLSTVVCGQPNIYALFMAASAAMLRKQGDFIFIIPRSFTSGLYFRKFRKRLFYMIRPTTVHIFGSRREAFRREDVLQENVILSGLREDADRRRSPVQEIVISSSRGVADLGRARYRKVALDACLNLRSLDRVLRLPLCEEDEFVMVAVDSWPCSLETMGLRISTGPVVPFRSVEHVARFGEVPYHHVPLLWMNHVRAMRAEWPLNRNKPEFILRKGAEAVLVPNQNYVLLRRFSAKEEPRRLIAAPYLSENFSIPEIGLENHLNYVYRPGASLSEDETWGLAALYNSQLLDKWFRVVNGNTQVSATELRSMPLPPLATIVSIGRRVKTLNNPMDGLDALVRGLAGVPEYGASVDG